MRLIGYWIRSLWDEDFPPPQEFVINYDPSFRKCITDYLEAGHHFRSYLGFSWCRICNIDLGAIELSDGQWVWPSGLSHYVWCHNVRLPNEFNATVKAGGPASPHPEDEWSTLVSDKAFWIDWCRTHRSGSLASKFSIVRKLATEQATIFHAFKIKEHDRKEGISDRVCQRLGCSKPAINDSTLCTACILESDVESRLTGNYANLRQVLSAESNIDTQLVLFP